MNPNLPSIRKSVRLLIGLIILLWATETLMHQWGFGAELPYDHAEKAGELRPPELDDRPREKFVPGTPQYLAGAILELRSQSMVASGEIKLRDVCRWADADKTAFDPIADLVVMRVGGNVPFRGLALEDLKQTLSDAGVNMAVIHFAGALSCTIERNDVKTDERTALEQWIAARSGVAVASAQSSGPASAAKLPDVPIATANNVARQNAKTAPEETGPKTLRSLLVTELAERLQIPADSLQIKFNPLDEKMLVLTEPQFRFNVEGTRSRMLGNVAWDVTVVTDTGSHRAHIAANARAWQDQIIVVRPLAYRQTVQEADVLPQRVLVNQLSDEPLLKKDQVVGQLAARELKPGALMTARLVDVVPLAKPGDLISITVDAGNVQIKTQARAMESGSFGQSIKVKNESTRDVFVVTLTGPQQARVAPAGGTPTIGTNVGDPNIASLDRN